MQLTNRNNWLLLDILPNFKHFEHIYIAGVKVWTSSSSEVGLYN